jgi:hypothetical protein
MDVIKLVQPRKLGDLLVHEIDPNFCRESVVLMAGSGAPRSVPQFSVVGAVDAGETTATGSANAGNIGNGTIGSVSASVGASPGDYRIVVIEHVAGHGAFQVFRPDDELDGESGVDGEGNVDTAYAGSINFTITHGGTDLVAGDGFTVHVPFGQGVVKYVQLDLTGTDGRQRAAGVSLFDAWTPDGVDGNMKIIDRGPAVLRSEEVIWPAGITADQQAQITAELRRRDIKIRQSQQPTS